MRIRVNKIRIRVEQSIQITEQDICTYQSAFLKELQELVFATILAKPISSFVLSEVKDFALVPTSFFLCVLANNIKFRTEQQIQQI